MNGKKAKEIRREIYGRDMSQRDRRYRVIGRTLLDVGLRRKYQDLKRDYLESRRG
jgi:hypothetical protein